MGWGRKEPRGFLSLSLGMVVIHPRQVQAFTHTMSSLVLLLLARGVDMDIENSPESI